MAQKIHTGPLASGLAGARGSLAGCGFRLLDIDRWRMLRKRSSCGNLRGIRRASTNRQCGRRRVTVTLRTTSWSGRSMSEALIEAVNDLFGSHGKLRWGNGKRQPGGQQQ